MYICPMIRNLHEAIFYALVSCTSSQKTPTYTHIRVCVYIYIHSIYIFIYIYIYTFIYIYIYVHICICIYMYVCPVLRHLQEALVHRPRVAYQFPKRNKHMCVCVCVCRCIYIYIYIHTHIHFFPAPSPIYAPYEQAEFKGKQLYVSPVCFIFCHPTHTLCVFFLHSTFSLFEQGGLKGERLLCCIYILHSGILYYVCWHHANTLSVYKFTLFSKLNRRASNFHIALKF